MKGQRLRLKAVEPTEADVLASVLRYLTLLERMGRVAWFARMNTGAGRLARKDGTVGQFMRFGFPGCPDILGQLPDGRVLAMEVKRPSGKARVEQGMFLARVARHNGVSAVVRSIDDVDRVLG